MFQKHDPGNQLLAQARQELLDQELDIDRLAATLQRMQGQALSVHALARATPFAFPLMVERFRERLSNEPLAERIARMVAELERAAGGAAAGEEGVQSVREALRLSGGEAPDTAGEKGRRTRTPRKVRRRAGG